MLVNYIVQVDNKGLPTNDFGLSVIEQVRYQNWLNNKEVHSFELATNQDIINRKYTGIPVGSIEFVETFLDKSIIPINIPPELMEYQFTGRKICIGTYSKCKHFIDNFCTKNIFIKSNDKIKEFTELVPRQHIEEYIHKEKSYLFSEDIEGVLGEIIGEYRVFVFRGKILDCRRYLGNWYAPKPSAYKLLKMVESYKDCSPAYTLDVAVTATNETVLIEVHNFIACGLYGFNSNSLLSMLAEAYRYEKTTEERV